MTLSIYGSSGVWTLIILMITFSCSVHAQVQLGADIDGESDSERSGTSVSSNHSGDRLAVGSPYADGPSGAEAGKVRVFEWSGSSWSQLGQDLEGEGLGDRFGNDVKLNADGNRLAVGGPRNDQSGHVRVFEWNNANWVQLGQDIDGQNLNEQFGSAIAINDNGDRVAIGAPSSDVVGVDAGLVEIYEWNGNTWEQVGSTLQGSQTTAFFGKSISFNGEGDYLAVGAPGYDNGLVNRGQVEFINWRNGSWDRVQTLEGDEVSGELGESLDLNSNADRIVIGAPGKLEAYMYDLVAGTWMLQTTYSKPSGSNYGASTSINGLGDVIAVSDNEFNAGRTEVYKVSSTGDWTQIGNDIDGEDNRDESGTGISLNDSGNRLVVGAPFNSESNINAGHVRIYDLVELLPVDLISFTTETKEDKVLLQWTTASEYNNAGFYIQHSLDATRWENLTWLNGLGDSKSTQSYSFVHDDPVDDINYYRLIQEDIDGTKLISEIRKEVIKGDAEWSVFPNPANNMIYTNAPSVAECVIYSSNGYSVPCNKLSDGIINLTELPVGIYSIELKTSVKSEIIRLVKY